ncbi:MAG: S1C family serine protease [bacterium]
MNKKLFLLVIISILVGSIIGGIIGSLLTFNLVKSNNLNKNASTNNVLYKQTVVIKEADKNTFVKVIENVKPAVARVDVITTDTPWSKDWDDFFKYFFGPDWDKMYKGQGIGSAFIIDSNKYYLVTNNHVIEKAKEIYITFPDNSIKYKADIVGNDPFTDLALIKLDITDKNTKLPALEFDDSDSIKIGEWVIAVGNPYGFDYSATVGVISAKNRTIDVGNLHLEDLIQTDAPINPGNSGGPLVDLNGKVVGVNTAVAIGAQGIGFAIPSNKAQKIIKDLETFGKVVRPNLGIEVIDLTPEIIRFLGINTNDGVMIKEIETDGPADKAGLKKGDIIYSINSEIVKNTIYFRKILEKYKPGDNIKIDIIRLNKKLSKNVILGSK